jgi:hypothetical protein
VLMVLWSWSWAEGGGGDFFHLLPGLAWERRGHKESENTVESSQEVYFSPWGLKWQYHSSQNVMAMAMGSRHGNGDRPRSPQSLISCQIVEGKKWNCPREWVGSLCHFKFQFRTLRDGKCQ